MLRVIRNHRNAALGKEKDYENLPIKPIPLDFKNCPDGTLPVLSREIWDEALKIGEQFGFRNAQVTVIAPTGTIGLIMDCDTTGIEPDFALVKFKNWQVVVISKLLISQFLPHWRDWATMIMKDRKLLHMPLGMEH